MDDDRKSPEEADKRRPMPQGDAKDTRVHQPSKRKDRPGFDLGGADSDNTAGSGLGIGPDASENREDRRLPRHLPGKPSS